MVILRVFLGPMDSGDLDFARLKLWGTSAGRV